MKILTLALLALAVSCAVDGAADGPARQDLATPGLPLILILHGAGSSGSEEATYENAYSLGSAAVILAPDLVEYWDGSVASCYQNCERDDVATLSALVEASVASGGIDPARVRVIGHSSGAIMAWRLLCERPDLFRAGVIFEGFANAAADPVCAPSQPINVLHVHGTADAVILYDISGTLPDMTVRYPSVQYPSAVVALPRDLADSFTARLPGSLAQEGVAAGCSGDLAYEGLVTGAVDGELVESWTRPCAGHADHWRVMGGNHVPPLASTWIEAVMTWMDGTL